MNYLAFDSSNYNLLNLVFLCIIEQIINDGIGFDLV